MILDIENPIKLVFDLKIKNEIDKEHVKRVQELILNKESKIGLSCSYGLYNTKEWWDNIYNKNIPQKVISGTITRLFYSGQDSCKNYNSFDFVDEKGEKYSSSIYLNNLDDLALFSIGKKIYILYIYEELKSGDIIDLVVEMAISIN